MEQALAPTKTLRGTVGLHPKVFERWRSVDYFYEDFSTSCEIHGIRAGLRFSTDKARVSLVVDEWLRESDRWLKERLPDGNTQLNHLKRSGILLHCLCKWKPVKLEGPAPEEASPSYQDGGGAPPKLKSYDKEDIRQFEDGGTEYLAWLFIYQVCEWFERERLDRKTSYVSRIAPDLEHDMIHFLRNGGSSEAIFMILMALFIRD
jgi:hypothetical protein